jgi:pimeloyl-ACP methyl ester carboxylesterase
VNLGLVAGRRSRLRESTHDSRGAWAGVRTGETLLTAVTRTAVEAGAARDRLAVRLDEPELQGRSSDFAILYLHGFGSSQSGEKASYFRERAVEAGWAFCSFDFRGHGDSGGTMRELSLTRNLEDVAAVRAFLVERGHRRLALFGSSMGGATALWEGSRAPESVAAVALIAPAVGLRAALERWAGPEGLERWRRSGVIDYHDERVDCELGWQLMEDLRQHPLEALLAAYRVPTVIFQGKLDDTVDWHEVAAVAERLGPETVDLRLFDGSGHRLTDRLPQLWGATRAHFAKRIASPPLVQRPPDAR